jgi:hypothetical protein
VNDYRGSLATILETSAVPYGLSLATWGSGTAVEHFRGAPQLWEIFAFLLGGLSGYALATVGVLRELPETPKAAPGTRMALAGLLHVIAAGAAVGVASLAGEISNWVAWPLAGLGGILTYLTLAAAEYRFARRFLGAD